MNLGSLQLRIKPSLFFYLVRLFIYCFGIFFIHRFIFLVANFSKIIKLPADQILNTFFAAWKIDLSTACYILFLHLFLCGITWIIKKEFNKILMIGSVIIFTLYQLINLGEIQLYQEWQQKLNTTALAHLLNPQEIFQTITLFELIGAILFIPFIVYFTYLTLKKWVWIEVKDLQIRSWTTLTFLLPVMFLLFTGLRGGWSRFPISESHAFHSIYPILNDAAVNPGWHLLHHVLRAQKDKGIPDFSQDTDAKLDSILHQTYLKKSSDSIPFFLSENQPNIFFIILESWPADACDGEQSELITPNFQSLKKSGIYFDQVYASGFVSDQGIPAILSAFPSAGSISITAQPEKSSTIPSLAHDFIFKNYSAAFYYGGQLDYGNIRSYVYNAGFQTVLDRRDFEKSQRISSLGVPDKIIAPLLPSLVNKLKAPFMACWYTLSSHSPYDIPESKDLPLHHEKIFSQTVHYSDDGLGVFFETASNQSWYDHTLFILVSDHSHESQIQRPLHTPQRHRIPLLFVGKPIKSEWKGKIISTISSQLDIASTLLYQSGMSDTAYKWSQNIIDKNKSNLAVYNFVQGAGMITDSCFVAFDARTKEDQFNTDCTDFVTGNSLKNKLLSLQQSAKNYFNSIQNR